MSSADGRPRIVHVLDRFGIGGMEQVALALIGRTLERYDHRIVCLRGTGELAPRVEALGVVVESIDKKPGKDPRAYARLCKRLRQLRPAVVHTYNIGALDVAFWARLAGVPRVVHAEHGRDVSDPEGRSAKYRWLRRVMAPLISVYVPVSQDLARWLRNDVKLPASRIQLIYNGIDTARYAVASGAGTRSEALRIGSVGRLDPVKGFDRLIEAIARLNDRNARLATLHIVGDGPARTSLEQKIVDEGLSERVFLHGSRDDVPAFLADLDVYVCSSIAEGVALTVLEAMAASRPIVATAVGGNPELIDHERNGLLVPSRDAGALAKAVGRLLDDRTLAVKLGDAAREDVCARFSVEAMIDGYCTLYDRLIQGHRKTVCVD
ncbi:glycosyltransferase [Salinisphaera sp. T31B1]|uniref:glycosyltransferase n=1 Tax=Salinisphaera sp. T31B1 TaxID=727963 RepID=UPI00334028FA